ncbi:MAG: hypothetical protein A2096_01370 [Spirochaetes bacterium GWF1_41_5]|nr:MAG: hypothetical protein A2096_01370 [Spirochaetes bacterium GWF1_41_5]HBE02003.1 hypothetical protein [Spirochaetia bacterium]
MQSEEKKRIMIVENIEQMNSLYRHIFPPHILFHIFDNPLNALKAISCRDYALIICNNSLPFLSGMEFAQKCYSLNPRLGVVFYSISREIYNIEKYPNHNIKEVFDIFDLNLSGLKKYILTKYLGHDN